MQNGGIYGREIKCHNAVAQTLMIYNSVSSLGVFDHCKNRS